VDTGGRRVRDTGINGAGLLPGAAYDAAVAEAGDDAEALADLGLLLHAVTWERDNRLIIPRAPAMHILGVGIARGDIYVRPTPESFELWGLAYYAVYVARARQRRSTILPD
jgi:hypothetical protein